MRISSSYGRIISGYGRTTTSVYSDGQGSVSSSTSHSNRLRVKWSNGKESYDSWKVDGDHGDVIVGVWGNGRCIGESNATLGQNYFYKETANTALIVLSVLLCLVIIGFPLLFYFGFIHPAIVSNNWKVATIAELQRLRNDPEFEAFMRARPVEPGVAPA